MSKPEAVGHFTPGWKQLVESVLLANPETLPQRLQEAQDAIMDEIEDSFHSASLTERQALINAMNSLRELRRVSVLTVPSKPCRKLAGTA